MKVYDYRKYLREQTDFCMVICAFSFLFTILPFFMGGGFLIVSEFAFVVFIMHAFFAATYRIRLFFYDYHMEKDKNLEGDSKL